jgi:DNA ligase-1
MRFKDLALYLDKLERISSRNEITQILASIFKKAKADEVDKITYLVLGRLAPSYREIVFNLAERMMEHAIAKAYKQDFNAVQKLYKQKGDLGMVVWAIAKTQSSKFKTQNLSVSQVYKDLLAIAQDEGEGSQERKIVKMSELLARLDPLSARFVARIPVGKLRLGFSDKTVIDALSVMRRGDKSAKKELERAYGVVPDTGLLAKRVKELGIKKATRMVKPVVGVPVLPMLAQRLKSPTEMIKKMGKVAIEPKLDGLRVQIHFEKGEFPKAFTRNLHEISWMFPELTRAKKYLKAHKLILDTEAIGLDEKTLTLASFQATMTRRRKHAIKEAASKVPIKFYVFDILLKDRTNLMDKTYPERRKVLEETVEEGRLFALVDYVITQDPEKIKEMNVKKQKEGFEGIMIKRIDSSYVPGRTGWRWVKMKESEKSHAKLSDTVDCVVMGYSVGKGKRAGFGVGQFLVGVRKDEKIKTVTKVGTGLTDEQFRELATRLRRLGVSKKPKEYVVHKILEPDFWVKPELVVEIAADEITKSPTHSAGLALRFPRLVRFRDDKSPAQATTISELRKLYDLQKS